MSLKVMTPRTRVYITLAGIQTKNANLMTRILYRATFQSRASGRIYVSCYDNIRIRRGKGVFARAFNAEGSEF